MAIAAPGTGTPSVLVTAFRCFSLAIRLLSDPETYIVYNKFAKGLLHCFVDSCTDYFGKHFVALVVHILLHLPDECKRIGPLEHFSCWKYENALKTIKKRCRSYKSPLKALSTQLCQKSTFISKPARTFPVGVSESSLKRPIVSRLPDQLLDGQSYRTVFIKQHVLTIDSPDCFFISKTKQVYEIEDIVDTTVGIKLICRQFGKRDCAYYIPTDTSRFESSTIGVFRLLSLNEGLEIVDLTDFARKAVVRVIDNVQYCYPLLRLK